MNNMLETHDVEHGTRYIGPAEIVGIDRRNGVTVVKVDRHGSGRAPLRTRARPAMPAPVALRPGQKVLVAGDVHDDYYIIGMLDDNMPEMKKTDTVETRCGVRAVLSEDSGGEKLRILSRQGKVMFEYDAITGNCRAEIRSGDIEIESIDGAIDFSAAKGIRFRSDEDIEITGGGSVSINAEDGGDGACSTLELGNEKISVISPELKIDARSGNVHLDETVFIGDRAKAEIGTVKFITERIESITGTVIEKIKNLYRTVEGLQQVRSHRMRTIVDATYHFKSRKAFIKAEEDVKIKGEKIYLG